jgi:hypothetical protein
MIIICLDSFLGALECPLLEDTYIRGKEEKSQIRSKETFERTLYSLAVVDSAGPNELAASESSFAVTTGLSEVR